MFELLHRLHATSGILQDWGSYIARANSLNKKDLEAEIARLQTFNNLVDNASLVEAKLSLSKLLVQEERYWKQRAKVFWLKEGDLNTRFFHQMASARKKTNRINGLYDDEGRWVTSKADIHNVVREYFSGLFAATENVHDINRVTSTIRCRVSQDQNEALVRNFDEDEFRVAIFQMHKDKSPGHDGFNPAFYKKFRTTIGPDIVENGIRWLEKGSFRTSLNNTTVVLIPKVEQPKSMKDLRPILLCNVIYKIVLKVMCNRLKSVLPSLIDEAQSAFQSGRYIQDNALIAFEALHAMKNHRKGKMGGVALKIDISKAYDRVEWRYLDVVLRSMGFDDKWVTWMGMCVRTVSYSFLVNEELVCPIIPGRGLRQGDPLSPYLFILCTESLSGLLTQQNRRGNIHGHRVCCRAPSVSHLFFADECLLFCRASREECHALKSSLMLYERASGQAINYQKFGIHYSPIINAGQRDGLNEILGVSNPLNTGRYLGLPSLIGQNKVENFRYVKDRLWAKLQHWRGKKSSKAGKEILIKAAAQSIPAYCMSTFFLPPTLIDELHRMLNAFWWGHGSDPKKGVKWTTWEALCTHKNDGGMGFRNLHMFNVAMLGKLVWRLHKCPNSLVGRILKARYFANQDLLHAGLGRNSSFTWRGIHTALGLVKKGIRWKVGEGNSVCIWGIPWLKSELGFNVTTPTIPTFKDMVVKDLFIPGTRLWDYNLIMEVFNDDDRGKILRTTPAPSEIPAK